MSNLLSVGVNVDMGVSFHAYCNEHLTSCCLLPRMQFDIDPELVLQSLYSFVISRHILPPFIKTKNIEWAIRPPNNKVQNWKSVTRSATETRLKCIWLHRYLLSYKTLKQRNVYTIILRCLPYFCVHVYRLCSGCNFKRPLGSLSWLVQKEALNRKKQDHNFV